MRNHSGVMIAVALVTVAGSTNCTRRPVFKVPDRVHDVAVLLFMSDECTLSTTAPYLLVRRGERINFHLVNVDSKCPSGTLEIDDTQWKDTRNRPVKPPLDPAPGPPPNGKSYRARNDRDGAYKYTLKVGSVVLDPEIEIEK